MIDYNRIRNTVATKNEDFAKFLSKYMYKNITDEDWDILVESKNSPLWNVLIKIQDEVYNHYVEKLVTDLQASTQMQRDINATVFAGLLEGIHEASLREIYKEGRRRRENRKADNKGNRPKLQTYSINQSVPRL